MRLLPPTHLAALVAAATSALAFAPGPAWAQPLPSSVVAYTGQVAPGTGGATYLLLFTPVVTRTGDVAFRAELTGAGVNATNNKGYWGQDGGGPVGLLRRAGDATPLPDLTWSTNLDDPAFEEIDSGARLGFYASVFDGVATRDAIWTEQPDGTHNVAIRDALAPGIPGATFTTLPMGYETPFVETGHTLFRGNVTGGGTTPANDFGLWLDDGVGATLIFQEGSQAPGLPPGSNFGSSFFSPPLLADGGVVTFLTTVQVAGLPKSGIWSTHGGVLSPLALEEEAIAGLGAGERIGGFSPISGNRHGQIAFWGPIENSLGGSIGWGLWVSDPGGSLSLVYRRGGGSPGLQLEGSQFQIADDGLVYMITNYLPGPGPAWLGVFAIGSGGWRELARQGDRVADSNAGVEYQLFDQILANGNGQVAFRATIAGPGVGGGGNQVLVAHGNDRLLHLVARTGESLEVAPGLFRTITSLLLTQSVGGPPGVRRGFSDDGGLVWHAGTGGISSAILVTDLGVPPTVQLVGLEAVQVVQDWTGTVPLVQGKRTLVRAHLQSNPPVRVDPVLRARPLGGGAELPHSPLRASNPDGYVLSDPDPGTQRALLFDSAYWEIPLEWTLAGPVELEVELLDPLVAQPLDCLEAALPVANDCAVGHSFAAVDEPEMTVVSVEFLKAGVLQSFGAERRRDLVDRWLSALPVRSIDWNESRMLWPAPAPPNPDVFDVRAQLRIWRAMNGCHDAFGCKRVFFGAIPVDEISGLGDPGGTASTAYIDSDPLAIGRHSSTHELGHNLGIGHAVDFSLGQQGGMWVGRCGEKARPSQDVFPHFHDISGQIRPTLGPMDQGLDSIVYGFDTLQNRVVAPDRFFELMSYCRNPGIDRWPSAHTYGILKTAIESRFDSLVARGRAADSAWGGEQYLLVGGQVDSVAGTAVLDRVVRLESAPALPPPPPGPWTLRVHRAGGATDDLPFEPELVESDGGVLFLESFLVPVPLAPEIAAVELLQGTTLRASRTASPSPPVVGLTYPNGGEVISSPSLTVTWTAADADLDPLEFALQFSADGGATWRPLATNAVGTSLDVDRTLLAGTSQGMLRVLASDGLRTAADVSDALFTVEGNAPQVAIASPVPGTLFHVGQVLSLAATALDAEDGPLSGPALSWSSSLSGALGSGAALSVPIADLADGLHVVTVTAEDSDGQSATAAVQVRVNERVLVFEDDFESGGMTLWQ